MSARVTVVVSLLVGALLLSGCGLFTTKRSNGVVADEVVKVELYEYPWGQDEQSVRRLVIERGGANEEALNRLNEEAISLLVKMFTDTPTTRLGTLTADDVYGSEALGVRYVLSDGSVVEVTRIFRGYHDVVVIWPDGKATATTWGSPNLLEHYASVRDIEEVDASERPHAELP